jgi:hypothetical protein
VDSDVFIPIGFPKTGPAGAGVIFVFRAEKDEVAIGAPVKAGLFVVPVGVIVWRFCSAASGYIENIRRQDFPPLLQSFMDFLYHFIF